MINSSFLLSEARVVYDGDNDDDDDDAVDGVYSDYDYIKNENFRCDKFSVDNLTENL